MFCNLVANFKGVQLQGVQLSPLGFAACQSKKCTNKANSANYRRVWHPCHTHAPTKLSSHRSHRIFLAQGILQQNPRNTQKRLAQDILPQIAQMCTD